MRLYCRQTKKRIRKASRYADGAVKEGGGSDRRGVRMARPCSGYAQCIHSRATLESVSLSSGQLQKFFADSEECLQDARMASGAALNAHRWGY